MLGWRQDDCSGALPFPLASNLLLKQLPAADRAVIEPHFTMETVIAGTVLFDVGEHVAHAYFPVDTIIALEQAGGIEVALAGREGLAGWTAMAGFCGSPYRAIVRCCAGQLLKISIEALVAAAALKPKLGPILAQYIIVTAVQMAEGLGAHAHHRLEAAVARWLLMRHDRVGGDWIRAQHQEIADNLGARRASITDCLQIIEGDRQIRCRRGRILIRNRADLEVKANGAFGAAESLYRASFGAFGKSPSRDLPQIVDSPLIQLRGIAS